jgi:phosphoribosylanthranilate isomerase
VAVVGSGAPSVTAPIALAAGADVIQLHADPTADDVTAMRRHWQGQVWAALRVEGATLPPFAAELFDAADAVVLDARVAGALGGTGVTLPWAELAEALTAARRGRTLVLAGGLRPATVAEAAAALAPDVVDVSSGVESSPGVKRHADVLSFVAQAGRAGPSADAPPFA